MKYIEKGENLDPNDDNKRTVSVTLTYNLNTEDLSIDSEFETSGLVFSDPIGYTTHLIQMGLEKWIREKVGMVCPNCSAEMDETWDWCPKCGYSLVDEVEDE
jgi:hypothetical protein